ncbi:hypothetical protein V2J91_05150 [Pseudomonas alliivorans]|nr:hypothetical protein [Pseudomonas alliivorans]MEE5145471.1 hypothetical protein [Pseudomonas alliivorans]
MKYEIYACADEAMEGGVMDEEIYSAETIDGFATQNVVHGPFYVDLPIGDLVALQSRKFYPQGATWREAAKGLDCEGWGEQRKAIIKYFESDLEDNKFPAPGALGYLKINFVGGAAYCNIGNHRVVAMKAWLARFHGEHSAFKRVSCQYQDIYPPLKKLMVTCQNNGCTMEYAFVPNDRDDIRYSTGAHYLILVKRSWWRKEIYALDSYRDVFHRIYPSGNLILRLLRQDNRSKCLRFHFEKLSPSLVERVLNNAKAKALMPSIP